MTEGDYELSRIMCDCWTNFAKSGNPNGDSLPEWPLYDNTMPKMMTFNVPECGGCNAVDVDPDGKIQDAVNELLENLK